MLTACYHHTTCVYINFYVYFIKVISTQKERGNTRESICVTVSALVSHSDLIINKYKHSLETLDKTREEVGTATAYFNRWVTQSPLVQESYLPIKTTETVTKRKKKGNKSKSVRDTLGTLWGP